MLGLRVEAVLRVRRLKELRSCCTFSLPDPPPIRGRVAGVAGGVGVRLARSEPSLCIAKQGRIARSRGRETGGRHGLAMAAP